jgi:prevent-host-death family protein
MKNNKSAIVGLRQLRENTNELLKEIEKGETLTVFRRSEPLFKITPLDNDEQWEELVDFTKVKKGGVDIDDILSRL